MDILMGTLSRGGEVEVLEKPQRRRFTLEYKRRIVREADRCQKPGEEPIEYHDRFFARWVKEGGVWKIDRYLGSPTDAPAEG